MQTTDSEIKDEVFVELNMLNICYDLWSLKWLQGQMLRDAMHRIAHPGQASTRHVCSARPGEANLRFIERHGLG